MTHGGPGTLRTPHTSVSCCPSMHTFNFNTFQKQTMQDFSSRFHFTVEGSTPTLLTSTDPPRSILRPPATAAKKLHRENDRVACRSLLGLLKTTRSQMHALYWTENRHQHPCFVLLGGRARGHNTGVAVCSRITAATVYINKKRSWVSTCSRLGVAAPPQAHVARLRRQMQLCEGCTAVRMQRPLLQAAPAPT